MLRTRPKGQKDLKTSEWRFVMIFAALISLYFSVILDLVGLHATFYSIA